MKRLTLILVAIACFCAPSYAMWALVPLDDLVQDSDLIVVGALDSVSEYSQSGMDYGHGTILIDEVIWGAASAGESVTLKWQNKSGLVCPRVEHRENQGKKAIWLLTVEHAGVVRANYPGRFVDLSKRTEVEQILRKKPLCLRAAKYAFGADEPVNVSMVFRNPTQSSIAFPGVEFRDGQLLVSPRVALTLFSGYGETQKITSPLQGRVVSSKNAAPILVEPGQEFRLTVDLRKLFTISVEETYDAQLRVTGFGRSNAIDIYPSPPALPTAGRTIPETLARIRKSTSRFALLIPSIVAVIASSIFVFRHGKELLDEVQNRRAPST